MTIVASWSRRRDVEPVRLATGHHLKEQPPPPNLLVRNLHVYVFERLVAPARARLDTAYPRIAFGVLLITVAVRVLSCVFLVRDIIGIRIGIVVLVRSGLPIPIRFLLIHAITPLTLVKRHDAGRALAPKQQLTHRRARARIKAQHTAKRGAGFPRK